ncbi:Brix-domain-containing protein [Pleurotus eryngii]|uniref:Brix-domain-containing protein n=1 Tax=Pleurotus eryngii TaxID=5323 RepID=A0A9P5ZMM0_PLEER|nr:Brix-domain-containing protein [Pleurotus eryngii]
MAPTRSIRNKIKREEVARKSKRSKTQEKLKRRLAQAKEEASDPAAKKKRLAQNVPRTLDNTREFDPSILTADPSASTSNPTSAHEDAAADIAADPFADYFSAPADPSMPPKVLITTSPKASKRTYAFADELVGVFPGAHFVHRKKGKGFELGRIAGWAADRGYKHLCVINEDMKKPNAITLVHLPNGPTAYFKLTSIQLTREIFGHGRATPHHPELILSGLATRLGHTVGRLFQTLFPPLPEFQGRQVASLHNQRDFLFFRRHRYAFRSTEKVALQEIGPRFTLKLRSLRRDMPAVTRFGDAPPELWFDVDEKEVEGDETVLDEADAVQKVDGGEEGKDIDDDKVDDPMDEEKEDKSSNENGGADKKQKQKLPPKQDEFLWQWKPELETTRRTFFL